MTSKTQHSTTWWSQVHKQVAGVVLLGLTLLFTSSSNDLKAAEMIYFGTYTGGTSEGIYVANFDDTTGAISNVRLAIKSANPSFLAIHPNQQYLYAVNELGEGDSTISAFAIQQNGTLKFINQQSAQGGAPCHLIVDKTGKNVLIANYNGGNAGCLPIGENGKLKPISSLVQHRGSSVNSKRQDKAHAHSINLDSDNRFAFVADLGLDQVMVYRFDAEQGTLQPNATPFATTAPGSGPRHFDFHPSGKFAYVIGELLNTVTAFSYDAELGKLTQLQTISTLPDGYNETSHTADTQVHPSGKFLYGSNRGHDSIVVYQIDQQTGKLTLVEIESTQGKTPRNFGLHPSGKFLLAENQSSDTVVVFAIDAATGKLTPTGNTASVPSPVCAQFLAR